MVCSKQLFKEALGRTYDEPKRWQLHNINEIMNTVVTGWKPFSNPRMFAGYGRQKGWERDVSGNELPGNEDGFVELSEEECRQLEPVSYTHLLEVYEKADENGQLTDVQPHILFRSQTGRKPSNGTGWAAFSLSAFLPLGRIVWLRLSLSPHVVGIFEHLGQAQYPQERRKVLRGNLLKWYLHPVTKFMDYHFLLAALFKCLLKLFLDVIQRGLRVGGGLVPVSYTHLDVYKRQGR